MRRKVNLRVALLPVFESREPDRESELSKSHHRRVLGDLVYKEPELMDEYMRDRTYEVSFGSAYCRRSRAHSLPPLGE
jgi:hypothetical protein